MALPEDQELKPQDRASLINALKDADSYEYYAAGSAFQEAPVTELQDADPLLVLLRTLSAFQNREILARRIQSREDDPQAARVLNGVIELNKRSKREVLGQMEGLLPQDVLQAVAQLGERQWYPSGGVMDTYEFAIRHGHPTLLTTQRNPLFKDLPETEQVRDELAAALRNFQIWDQNLTGVQDMVRAVYEKGMGLKPSRSEVESGDDLVEIVKNQRNDERYFVESAIVKLMAHQGSHSEKPRGKKIE